METERMLRELCSVREKEKDRQYHTFEINVHSMVSDVIPKIEKLLQYEKLEEQIGMPLEYFFNKVGKTREFMVTVSGKRFYDATLLGGEIREDGSFVYCVLVHDAQGAPFHDYFAKIYTHEEAEKKLEEMKNGID